MAKKTLPQQLLSSRFWLEGLNSLLGVANLRLDTLTGRKAEAARLRAADARGCFTRPVFPVPACFLTSAHQAILEALPAYEARFASFARPADNEVGYQYENPYFRSPDTEVLYAILRQHRPRRILETGCGNSTKVIRQAIKDGGFPCHLTCIDPWPRRELTGLADTFIQAPVETQNEVALAEALNPGDVLFIDTSHKVLAANDVAFIYGSLLPRIRPGVIIHIHDIFLPYEYPHAWVFERNCGDWGEQYVVQPLLAQGDAWQVLWPGHYLQRTLPDFARHFPRLGDCLAQSLWLVKK